MINDDLLKVNDIPKAYKPANGVYEPYVFISYAHRDKELVFPIIKGMQDNGFRVWYDDGIEAGTEWPEYIAERIEKCSCFVCFISESAVESRNCRQEINFALSEKKDLLSIYLSDFKPPSGLRMLLGNSQSLFLFRFSVFDDFISKLSDAKIITKCRDGNFVPKPKEPKSSDLKAPTPTINKTKEQTSVPQKKTNSVFSNYKRPTLDLLEEDNPADTDKNAKTILSILKNAKINAAISRIERGASVTRYIVNPDKETKISKIAELSSVISTALKTTEIRIAVDENESAVAIEVPNEDRMFFRLRSVFASEEFKDTISFTSVCLGKEINGKPIIADVTRLPHLLVAGSPRSGVTTFFQSILASIMLNATPEQVKLILIDSKHVEFSEYDGVPHLLYPVIQDTTRAVAALSWLNDEMNRRYEILKSTGVHTISSYNEMADLSPENYERMPFIITGIYDLADLRVGSAESVDMLVMRLSQKARAVGIHLILGTTNPSNDVVTPLIKANVPSRLCCKVTSALESRTILDTNGAERLLDRGDALYLPTGALKPSRIQGAFISSEEIERITDMTKSMGEGAGYEKDIKEYIEYYLFAQDNPAVLDSQFADAVDVVMSLGNVSIAVIQRSLSIGYNKAVKYVEIMEKLGVAGEMTPSRHRAVLKTQDEWQNIRSKIQKSKR